MELLKSNHHNTSTAINIITADMDMMSSWLKGQLDLLVGHEMKSCAANLIKPVKWHELFLSSIKRKEASTLKKRKKMFLSCQDSLTGSSPHKVPYLHI